MPEVSLSLGWMWGQASLGVPTPQEDGTARGGESPEPRLGWVKSNSGRSLRHSKGWGAFFLGTTAGFLFAGILPAVAVAPLLIAWRRFGAVWGGAAVTVGVLFLLLTVGTTAAAVGFLLAAGAPASLLGWTLKNFGAARGIGVAAGVYGVAVILAVLASGSSLGGLAQEAVGQTFKTMGEAGGTSLPEGEVAQLSSWVGRLAPSLVVAMTAVMMWWNVLVARAFAGEMITADDLALFRLPFPLVMGVMGAALPVVFQMGPIGGDLPRLGPALDVGLNLLLVLAVAYTLQGVAVVVMTLRRWRLGLLASVFATVAVMTTVLLAPLPYLLLGLFDPWFDFRKLEGSGPESGAGGGVLPPSRSER